MAQFTVRYCKNHWSWCLLKRTVCILIDLCEFSALNSGQGIADQQASLCYGNGLNNERYSLPDIIECNWGLTQCLCLWGAKGKHQLQVLLALILCSLQMAICTGQWTLLAQCTSAFVLNPSAEIDTYLERYGLRVVPAAVLRFHIGVSRSL